MRAKWLKKPMCWLKQKQWKMRPWYLNTKGMNQAILKAWFLCSDSYLQYESCSIGFLTMIWSFNIENLKCSTLSPFHRVLWKGNSIRDNKVVAWMHDRLWGLVDLESVLDLLQSNKIRKLKFFESMRMKKAIF